MRATERVGCFSIVRIGKDLLANETIPMLYAINVGDLFWCSWHSDFKVLDAHLVVVDGNFFIMASLTLFDSMNIKIDTIMMTIMIHFILPFLSESLFLWRLPERASEGSENAFEKAFHFDSFPVLYAVIVKIIIFHLCESYSNCSGIKFRSYKKLNRDSLPLAFM